MKEKVIYIGLDVDDKNFHGAAFIAGTGEVIDFKCRPNTKGLINHYPSWNFVFLQVYKFYLLNATV